MTATSAASAMRKVAQALERAGSFKLNEFPEAMLEGETAVGAAAFLCYLRDCLTSSPKEHWSQGELLVLLETLSRDAEMFPCGIAQTMWNAEEM